MSAEDDEPWPFTRGLFTLLLNNAELSHRYWMDVPLKVILQEDVEYALRFAYVGVPVELHVYPYALPMDLKALRLLCQSHRGSLRIDTDEYLYFTMSNS